MVVYPYRIPYRVTEHHRARQSHTPNEPRTSDALTTDTVPQRSVGAGAGAYCLGFSHPPIPRLKNSRKGIDILGSTDQDSTDEDPTLSDNPTEGEKHHDKPAHTGTVDC